jgi:hypothetical protein
LTDIDIPSKLTLWGSEMNRDHLKVLVRDLEIILSELKSEVYSDTESYIDTDKYYSDIDDNGD